MQAAALRHAAAYFALCRHIFFAAFIFAAALLRRFAVPERQRSRRRRFDGFRAILSAMLRRQMRFRERSFVFAFIFARRCLFSPQDY